MKYEEHVDKERRLVILKLLDESVQYSASFSFARDFLANCGLGVAQDRFDAIVGDLAERGYLSVADVLEQKVLTLTTRGQDVAKGFIVVEDIKRPTPEV